MTVEANPDESLCLVSYRLFSEGSEESTGLVNSAVYFIGACIIRPRTGELIEPASTYMLIVMDEVAAARDTQEEEDDSTLLRPVYVVPEVAVNGVIEFMKANYLEVQDPTRINELRPYLVGPITDDMV